MRKLNLFPSLIILVITFSNCSKEPLEYESPYKRDLSFFFIMGMEQSIPTSYGYEDLSAKNKWGPAMSLAQDFDPANPSTTIKVNNKFSVPVEMQGDLLINFVLRKKGTDPIGRYDVLLSNGETAFHMVEKVSGKSYLIHKDSIKFNVSVVGKSSLFGKYAEGNYTLNVVEVKDTTKLIPVYGGFRLHMME